MAGEKMYKYGGSNEELFMRMCMDDYNAKAVIIVPDTHNAIIVKDGQMMTTLDSGSHEIFDTKRGFFGKKKTENHTVEAIYMSKTYKLKIFWGTKNKFEVSDPLTGIPIKMGASGEFTIQICNPRKAYLELIGTSANYSADDLKEYMIGQLINEIEPAVASVMREKNLSYNEFSLYKKSIADTIFPVLSKWCQDSYGLQMFNFIISNVLISDEDKQKIEDELIRRKDELKQKEKKEEDKQSAKEIAAELERLDDKNYERKLKLKELESKDYEKYLEVLKIIGVNKEIAATAAKGAAFCTKCGHSFENGDKFCPGCGAKVGKEAAVCPNCKKENVSGAAFCSGCGTKLN